ncbi:hypothetical protein TIFTF001_037615 [Ficus carica]|uniref:Uncharacterized protein n=1 Tax=Ficus carica TaxID=3494 RepID=A0AA88JCP2_FICCA|nr:hypothetical protein TIFTF001_037601 [Ficus carica]GMN68557.1 hypothetical protein TIFTF001_037615 [Ficus carica]
MRKPATGATTTNNSSDNNSQIRINKTTTACCSKVGIKRGPWTAEEDKVLANFIRKEGEGRWRTLPKRAGLLRCGKSCRLRWMNYLRPSVKRGHIAPDEEDLILRLHRLLGNRWSLIAGRIPGRTDNEIKNYWNTHLSKKLISQGIDPRTHKPLNSDQNHDTNNSSSSSKTNRRMFSNPNPNNTIQTPTVGEDPADHPRISTSGGTQMSNKEKNSNYVDVGDQYQSVGQLKANFQYGYENLPGSDVFMSSKTNNFILEEDADDMSYCADDVLSSFLNSLINEDAFNGSAPFSTDAFGSSVNTTSNGWESAITSCADFNENINSQRVDDRVE